MFEANEAVMPSLITPIGIDLVRGNSSRECIQYGALECTSTAIEAVQNEDRGAGQALPPCVAMEG